MTESTERCAVCACADCPIFVWKKDPGRTMPPFGMDDMTCYRLGYELRGRALAEAEKERDTLGCRAKDAEELVAHWATRARAAEERAAQLERALTQLLRWAEMEIDANQHTGHFMPHGYVHDQACTECVGAKLGFLCGYHNAVAISRAKPRALLEEAGK